MTKLDGITSSQIHSRSVPQCDLAERRATVKAAVRTATTAGTWGAYTMQKRHEEPQVGVFWLLDGVLIIRTTPVAEAERYGDVLNYPVGHDELWTALQQQGIAPHDFEYSEVPRGRVGYYVRQERYWLRADRCILKRKDILRQIRKAMQLPEDIIVESDEHYSCEVCEGRRRREEHDA